MQVQSGGRLARGRGQRGTVIGEAAGRSARVNGPRAAGLGSSVSRRRLREEGSPRRGQACTCANVLGRYGRSSAHLDGIECTAFRREAVATGRPRGRTSMATEHVSDRTEQGAEPGRHFSETERGSKGRPSAPAQRGGDASDGSTHAHAGAVMRPDEEGFY